MFKKMGFAFLFSATVLLLAHNLVPHSHYIAGTGEVVTSHCPHNQGNLLGLLASVFHLDLGSDHLEDLKPATSQEVNLIAPFIVAIISFDIKVFLEKESKNYLYPPTTSLTNPFLLSLTTHRGPPAA